MVISEHKVWFVWKTEIMTINKDISGTNELKNIDNIMKYILLSILIIPFVSVMILFSLSNPVFGKTPQFYSVGECLMRTMKNRNLTGNKMFDVVHKECEKKMNITKTDIIEHKGELVRKYLEKREIGSFDQNKDMSFMILPSIDGL